MMDELSRAVRFLVRTVMDMPADSVRPAEQVAPVGGQTIEFATVKIFSLTDVGTPATSEENIGGDPDNVTTHVDQTKRFKASVQFFKSPPTTKDPVGKAKKSLAAFDRAQSLRQRLWLPSSIAAMNEMRIGLLDVGDARDLTALADTVYESRGSVDLTFNVIARQSEVTPAIRNVPVTTILQGGSSTTRTDEVRT